MKDLINSIRNFSIKHNTLLIFLIVLLVAIFFRVYKLTSIPYGLNNDAAWEGSAALNILHGNILTYFPYAAEGWRGEGIIRAIVALFIIIIGNNSIDIRLSSVIFGIGLIIPLFFLIKHLFDTKLATITSFFVAISGWHITMSKTGWRAIAVPFFATALFYFYFRGVASKKTINFIIAGVMLSIGALYTYDAGRIILFFFIFWIVFSFFSIKKFIIIYKKQLSLFSVSFLIISLPMIFYALSNWQNFTSRSDFLFIGSQIQQAGNIFPLIKNIIIATLTFNVAANGNDFFIFRPLVDAPVSWLIPIGFVICLWQIAFKRATNYFFIMLWFLFSMIPGILSAPNGNREIGAIPSVYFLAAVGIIFIVDLLGYIQHFKEKIKIALLILFLLVSSLATYSLYLGKNRLELPGLYPETLVTTNYIKTIWNTYDVYLTDNYPRELLTYYLYRNSQRNAFTKNYIWLDTSSSFLDIPISARSKKGLAFFMFANDFNEQTTQQLLQKYVNAKKIYLYYQNDNIYRPASLVLLVPHK
jgi:hypothetical protein